MCFFPIILLFYDEYIWWENNHACIKERFLEIGTQRILGSMISPVSVANSPRKRWKDEPQLSEISPSWAKILYFLYMIFEGVKIHGDRSTDLSTTPPGAKKKNVAAIWWDFRSTVRPVDH